MPPFIIDCADSCQLRPWCSIAHLPMPRLLAPGLKFYRMASRVPHPRWRCQCITLARGLLEAPGLSWTCCLSWVNPRGHEPRTMQGHTSCCDKTLGHGSSLAWARRIPRIKVCRVQQRHQLPAHRASLMSNLTQQAMRVSSHARSSNGSGSGTPSKLDAMHFTEDLLGQCRCRVRLFSGAR